MAELKTRAAVLISGRGSNLGALIEAARHPDYPAELALVLSNRADAAGLERARAAGIATAVVESRPYGRDRAGFEAAMQAVLEEAGIGLIALAGFMRVLTEGFVSAWSGRMLNIHPSLLPAFPGLDTHARAIAAGVRLHGCTVHFVTPGVDEGPIIAQAAVPVLPGEDESTLAARVLEQEHRIYPAALAWAASGAARLEEGRVVLAVPMAGGAFANPLSGHFATPTEMVSSPPRTGAGP
ncbi:phosphoribosylglycinamide formyltransferase [Pararoseomonas indoligenes]|uniref:Phosphoribosylglycinamide formyltransferase n=1 Tax=Roseomonas indoligenes TaxID=2820811 RepID=A0A940MUQ0_9PROT|nr:phosphoribosylglycinamide formyltransferase [Pararoseomonas indoligenes]MBP0491280.1 phosphoribosylglycinamide formyltransferase [Pararoseomonas indoligenes]